MPSFLHLSFLVSSVLASIITVYFLDRRVDSPEKTTAADFEPEPDVDGWTVEVGFRLRLLQARSGSSLKDIQNSYVVSPFFSFTVSVQVHQYIMYMYMYMQYILIIVSFSSCAMTDVLVCSSEE